MTRPVAQTLSWTLAAALHAGVLAWPVEDRPERPRLIEFTNHRFEVASQLKRPPPEPPPPKIVEPPPPPKPAEPPPPPKAAEPSPPPRPRPSPRRTPTTPPPAAAAPAKPAAPAAAPTPAVTPAAGSPATTPLSASPGGPPVASAAPAAPAAKGPASGPQPHPGSSAGGGGRRQLTAYGRGIHHAVSAERRYPFAARRLGLTGQAKVRVVIDRNGTLQGKPTLVQSSGHDVLDREAVAAVRRSSPFPPLPPGVGRTTAAFVIPIAFRLTSSRSVQ
ncbi:MAG: energy transducer TonB [Myxococcales bacterium FL481]|nr:MAG: energy transducer TonB [Myxococcales bacterium FL481]